MAVRRVWRWVEDHFIEWWWLDLPLAIFVVLLLGWFTRPGTGADIIGSLQLEDRRSIYTDLMQYCAIFGGLVGIAFTVYLGFTSRIVGAVKVRVGPALLRMWMVVLIVPWLAALTMIVVKATDRGGPADSANAARLAAYVAVILVALQLLRIMFVFFEIAMLELQPERESERTSRPLRLAR